MEANKYLVEKTIYAGRIGKTEDEVRSIINLCINTHLEKNPDLKFKEFGNKRENPDLSTTYTLVFRNKKISDKPLFVIVVPNGEHVFFVESADASERSIETSQELEMALKFENEKDAKEYMSWSSTRYRIEELSKFKNLF